MELSLEWLSNHAIEIIGLILGLFYLYYEYKAKMAVWIFAIIMPAISMTIYYRKGIYADFGINIYYLIVAIYGLWHWRRRDNSKTDKTGGAYRKITHTPTCIMIMCVVAMIVLWGALYFILTEFTDSNVPVPDAFTTALSIVGSWMLARKYVEQWIVWIIVDIVSVGLFIYKDIPFYAVLYTIYVIVAFFGYRNWLKKMHQYP